MTNLLDLPNETLLVVLLLLQRRDFDPLLLVCRRFAELIRTFDCARLERCRLARYTATLTLYSIPTLVKVDLLDKGASRIVSTDKLALMLHQVEVKRLIVLTHPQEDEWHSFIRRIRPLRKFWSRSAAYIWSLPTQMRLAHRFVELFRNCREIRFVDGQTWTHFPVFQPGHLYDLFARNITQLQASTCSLNAVLFFNTFLEQPRKGGVRRIIIERGDASTIHVMHQLMRNFVHWDREGKPVDHAVAFIIEQPVGMWWGHNINVLAYPWGELALQNGGTARLYDHQLDTYVYIHLGPHFPPHILFLPGSLAGGFYDVPTRKQMIYRRIHELQNFADF
ncbi:hypothetical protein AAVH_15420 [Aphelenchoides avenae]|nr:hypothetical protein AAVH_15420 [Aphelenchus avenae]